DEKVKLLRAIHPFQPSETVRGQYVACEIDGTSVSGYREEPDVVKDSKTQTYVAIRGHIDNWRWAGVPIFLRTGKRMPRRTAQAIVVLRDAPGYLFEGTGIDRGVADHISIHLQPDEGISLAFNAQEPGREV